MRRLLVLTLGLAFTLTAPAFGQPKTLLSVRDVMRHIVNPAAETYWKHTGVIDTEAGSDDRTPTSEADWKETIDAAAQVMEAGNLLMLEGRARDPGGPWMKYAQALVEAGAEGMAAAQAKDHDKVFDAGGHIYDACYNCHGRYIPRPKDSLYKHGVEGAVPPQ
jgi:hypothetical protein